MITETLVIGSSQTYFSQIVYDKLHGILLKYYLLNYQ